MQCIISPLQINIIMIMRWIFKNSAKNMEIYMPQNRELVLNNSEWLQSYQMLDFWHDNETHLKSYSGEFPSEVWKDLKNISRYTHYLDKHLSGWKDRWMNTVSDLLCAVAGTNQRKLLYPRLTLIPTWISYHMPSKVYDEITYQFSHFNGGTVEVLE